jgi:DNA-binding HxlR family transcriptional regulator
MAGMTSPRSCAIAHALDIVGERWSLLIVRELGYGVHRFNEIQANTGAPRDVLTRRLARLVEAGVIERRRYSQRPERFEYHLTSAGEELRPILFLLNQWSEQWLDGAPVGETTLLHSCGNVAAAEVVCSACGGGRITGADLRVA